MVVIYKIKKKERNFSGTQKKKTQFVNSFGIINHLEKRFWGNNFLCL